MGIIAAIVGAAEYKIRPMVSIYGAGTLAIYRGVFAGSS
jgi:hypothetical protein